ncbi:hypothetical protein GCM10009113_10860 [Marinobacter szutsaonensis]
MPAEQQLLLFPTHRQIVAVVDVEIGAGDEAFHGVPGLYRAVSERYAHIALTVLAAAAGQDPKGIVASITVHLTDGWHQVMHIRFHALEEWVVGSAVPASAFLPALALMPHHPSGHYMLPFDALRPVGLLAYLVAAGCQVYPSAGGAGPLPLAATIKRSFI